MIVGLTLNGRGYPVDPPVLIELARRPRAMALQTHGPSVTAAVKLEQLAEHGDGKRVDGDTEPLTTTPMTDEELAAISAAIRGWTHELGDLHLLPTQILRLRHVLADLGFE